MIDNATLVRAAEAFGAKASMQVAASIKMAVDKRPEPQSVDEAIREALESVRECRPELFGKPKRNKHSLRYIDR